MLVDLNDAKDPVNLQCQLHYGEIVAYCWYRINFLLLAFDKGFFVCVSTIPSEMGQEIYSVQDFKAYLSSLCINEANSKILLTGDNQIRVRELNQFDEIVEIFEVDIKNNGLLIIINSVVVDLLKLLTIL
ncbi:unnamed protein product [Onchocerca flexuosa]|uniref:CPSF_A domain-containing protein n=1 Tax=Onchocerca flexuosa TaxID=387005 RepID=A0A183HQ35_9BILA|nr:unnamed protein product [Onchocerca flexuosa]